jgi:metal-responsive CopG/Arc/MetJ family transcriptional regulator
MPHVIVEKHMKERRKAFTATLPIITIELLDRAAKETRMTRSAILEEALRYYLTTRRRRPRLKSRVPIPCHVLDC